jgi:hypothetical protein
MDEYEIEKLVASVYQFLIARTSNAKTSRFKCLHGYVQYDSVRYGILSSDDKNILYHSTLAEALKAYIKIEC